jgi:hypothetical protein
MLQSSCLCKFVDKLVEFYAPSTHHTTSTPSLGTDPTSIPMGCRRFKALPLEMGTWDSCKRTTEKTGKANGHKKSDIHDGAGPKKRFIERTTRVAADMRKGAQCIYSDYCFTHSSD